MRPAELHREDLPPIDERDAAKVVDGLRYVWRRPDLLLPMALMSVIGMSLFNFQLTLAALAKTVFHTGAASFGLFSTALAVGALVGALAGTGRRSRPSVWLVLGAAIACASFGTLVGLAPAYWLVVALLVPTGFFMVFFAQAANQRVQLGVDAAFRGRVMALWVLVFLGTNPVGAPVIGWVAERYGAGASIWMRRADLAGRRADRARLAAAPLRRPAAAADAARCPASTSSHRALKGRPIARPRTGYPHWITAASAKPVAGRDGA